LRYWASALIRLIAGRELGVEGLEQFRRSKMVMIAPKAEADPEWFPYPDDEAFN
jgi:betaine-aldehyde dehydrogenase